MDNKEDTNVVTFPTAINTDMHKITDTDQMLKRSIGLYDRVIITGFYGGDRPAPEDEDEPFVILGSFNLKREDAALAAVKLTQIAASGWSED